MAFAAVRHWGYHNFYSLILCIYQRERRGGGLSWHAEHLDTTCRGMQVKTLRCNLIKQWWVLEKSILPSPFLASQRWYTKTPHTLEVHLDTSYVHLNLEDPKCCISETLNVISFFPGPGLKYRIWGFVGSIHRYLLLGFTPRKGD